MCSQPYVCVFVAVAVRVIVGIERKEEQYAVAAACWLNLVTTEVTTEQKAVVFVAAGDALATASKAA